MSFKLLAVNGSLTPPPSRTRVILDVALEGARVYDASVETEVLELRDFALEFCDGRSPDDYNADTRRALALVEEADAYLVATPVYRASYTGALKNFFDLIPNDPQGADPLRGKVVGLLATGGERSPLSCAGTSVAAPVRFLWSLHSNQGDLCRCERLRRPETGAGQDRGRTEKIGSGGGHTGSFPG